MPTIKKLSGCRKRFPKKQLQIESVEPAQFLHSHQRLLAALPTL
jgi:hypothetical protein